MKYFDQIPQTSRRKLHVPILNDKREPYSRPSRSFGFANASTNFVLDDHQEVSSVFQT